MLHSSVSVIHSFNLNKKQCPINKFASSPATKNYCRITSNVRLTVIAAL